MQTIQNGYRSISLLMSINWDRFMYAFAIIGALYLGAVLGTLALEAVLQPSRY